MRRVRYGCAISLDGFIAGPNGEADWILMDPDLDFAAMMNQFDTFLIGRRTYQAMAAAGQTDMGSAIACYVFSRTLRPEDCPGATLVADDGAAVVERLRRQPGKDIALFGGGGLFRSLLDARQVDTVEVSVVPVLLGAGIPLMPGPYARVPLKLTAHRVLPKTGTLALEYVIGKR